MCFDDDGDCADDWATHSCEPYNSCTTAVLDCCIGVLTYPCYLRARCRRTTADVQAARLRDDRILAALDEVNEVRRAERERARLEAQSLPPLARVRDGTGLLNGKLPVSPGASGAVGGTWYGAAGGTSTAWVDTTAYWDKVKNAVLNAQATDRTSTSSNSELPIDVPGEVGMLVAEIQGSSASAAPFDNGTYMSLEQLNSTARLTEIRETLPTKKESARGH